jgi:hypothetical protein
MRIFSQGKFAQQGWEILHTLPKPPMEHCCSWRYNPSMLPDLQMNDLLRLRKPHPCGSYEWTVIRLGADIGLECKGCGHRVMLTRRELAKRLKVNLTKREEKTDENSQPARTS